jgi:hypothetical protein
MMFAFCCVTACERLLPCTRRHREVCAAKLCPRSTYSPSPLGRFALTIGHILRLSMISLVFEVTSPSCCRLSVYIYIYIYIYIYMCVCVFMCASCSYNCL